MTSNVYSFGVVLLEILTGRRAIDRERPTGRISLVEWALPFLHDEIKLKKIMDPKLADHCPKASFHLAGLILKCLEFDHRIRPSMEEVLETLHQIDTIQM